MSSLNENELTRILDDLKPETSRISISFVDRFIKNLLETIDDSKSKFGATKFDFETSGFKNEKYLNRVKGCGKKCPCCSRICDAEHYKVQTEIGSPSNLHKCNRGHQFRGMEGYRYEHSNKPSFKMCDSMSDNDVIRVKESNQIYRWADLKKNYPTWNFDSDSIQSVNDWKSKCTYIWSMIGKDLCAKYEMDYTHLAIDDSSTNNLPPIHFILVLDDSGSMNEKNKWPDLMKSVRSFLELCQNSSLSDDLISIILFSSKATLEVSSSSVYPELIDELRNPSYGGGTYYDIALQLCIKTLRRSNSSTHKYAIIFMSDGEADFPSNEMDLIHDKYMDQILNFWCVGFGNGKFDILKKMLDRLYKNTDNFHNPQDATALYATFKRIHVEVTGKI
jgi:hypothetical protein